MRKLKRPCAIFYESKRPRSVLEYARIGAADIIVTHRQRHISASDRVDDAGTCAREAVNGFAKRIQIERTVNDQVSLSSAIGNESGRGKLKRTPINAGIAGIRGVRNRQRSSAELVQADLVAPPFVSAIKFVYTSSPP